VNENERLLLLDLLRRHGAAALSAALADACATIKDEHPEESLARLRWGNQEWKFRAAIRFLD
jgi:hypothetical protein